MATSFLDHEGGRLAYEDFAPDSAATVIILVPGIGDLRDEYRLLVPLLLTAGLRPVTMDLRGTGESSVGWQEYTPQAAGSDMQALARHLDCGPVYLAGCSMAAASALWAAVESPDRVRGVIMLGPSLENGELSGGQRAAMAIGFTGPWKVRFWDYFYKSLYPASKPADFDAYCARLRANLDETGRFDALKAFMQASKAVATAGINNLTRPAIVIMGDRDPDYPQPAEKAAEYAAALHGDKVVIANSGHYPHADSPDAVSTAIVIWIQQQNPTHPA